MKLFPVLLALLFFAATTARGAEYVYDLGDGKSAVLLDGKEGQAAITDEGGAEGWFDRLGKYELRARLGHEPEGTTLEEKKTELKEHLRTTIEDWTEAEREGMVRHMKQAKAAADEVFPEFIPNRWYIVKTSGKDEGGAWYTRSDKTFFPKQWLDQLDSESMDSFYRHILLHENAHCWSRANPELREELYSLTGFQPVNEIDLGEWLGDRVLTNPDAPDLRWVSNVGSEESPRYGMLAFTIQGNDFSMEFQRLLMSGRPTMYQVSEVNDGSWKVDYNEDGTAVAIQRSDAKEFFEKLTVNSNYILHAEEVLAENLAMMVSYFAGVSPAWGQGSVEDPAPLEELAKALGLEVAEPATK